jgi:hypothetical protein
MRIALIHYHIKPGGVATVIKQQVHALKAAHEVLVLVGEPPESSPDFDTICISGLGYDRSNGKLADPYQVSLDIFNAIYARWPEGCDVLHIHNPTLAKNRVFLTILDSLQEKGMNLLLQIHDFAEDGRPNVFFKEKYPANCHYAVINTRDRDILLSAGLKPEGLHYLPNPVDAFDGSPGKKPYKNYVLYPVRAIRRKNIGEAILLSLFFKHNASLVITQPPNSPADLKSYHDWKKFVKEKGLDVIFEAGMGHDFPSLVYGSNCIITTSITEGFGFSFLEPWTAGKSIWGRYLPDICRDFEDDGIRLDHLYEKLSVPLDWMDLDRFRNDWFKSVRQIPKAFDYPMEESCIKKSYELMTANELIDFGILNERYQGQILSRLLNQRQNMNTLCSLNPFLYEFSESNEIQVRIRSNDRIVRAVYNKAMYAEKLINIYRRVLQTPVQQQIQKNVLLARFLNLENFSLLKWQSYEE